MKKFGLFIAHIFTSLTSVYLGYKIISYLSDWIDGQILGYDSWISLGWFIGFITISSISWIFLKKVRQSISLKKFSTSILLLAHVTATLFFMFAAAAGSMFADTEYIYNTPNDCKDNNNSPIENYTNCKGYGIFGFQNNSDYEITSYGDAKYSVCKLFEGADFSQSYISSEISVDNYKNGFDLHSKHGNDCDISSPEKSWNNVTCPPNTESSIKNCYQCARGLSNRNGHRFKVIGFSENCKNAMDISFASYGNRLIEKITNIYPQMKPEKKKKNPYIDAIQQK